MSAARPPIAVLGATSRIAQDFVLTRHAQGDAAFALYARRPEALRAFVDANGLPPSWAAGSLAAFVEHTTAARRPPFTGVLNAVGVGDPAAAQAMGAGIFAATELGDRLALAHQGRFPGTPYVFLSSGAVYGGDFTAPATAETAAVTPVNALTAQHWYSVAKLHAEAQHRARGGLTIVDVRVFNYVSRRLDPGMRFLVTDLARAVRDGAVFETVDAPLMRDYLAPRDMAALLAAALAAPAGFNGPVDAYSRAPVSKRELLAMFEREFGLRVAWREATDTLNATGAKPVYYSQNRAAQALGYAPTLTSLEGVRLEVSAMLAPG